MRLSLSEMKLATRVVLAAGLIGLLSIAALTIYIYQGSARILVERDTERLSGALDVSASRLNSRIEFYRQDTLLLAKTPPASGIFRAEAGGGTDPLDGSSAQIWRDRLATIFAGMLEARPEYAQVRYIGLANGGREIVRVDRMPDGAIRRIPDAELQQKANRPYVSEAFALGPGQVYLSPIDLNREHGRIEVPHRPMIRAATPVFSRTGEKLGIIVINVDMQKIFGLLRETLPKGTIHYIANREGDYLDNPDAARSFGFDLGSRFLMQRDFPALGPLFGGSEDRYSGIIRTSSGKVLTVAKRVYYDPQDPSRYLVVAEMSEAGVLAANMAAVRKRALLGAALVLLLGMFAMLWLARSISRPLVQIGEMAAAVADGERQVDLAGIAGRRDEIGRLARSFETMVEKVEARENELAAEQAKLEQANRNLERSNEQLERSNKELSQFAYVASHDLQEPLRMVDSYMGLIERRYKGRLDQDADEFIGYAVDGARRMKRLINELLAYSRVSNRKMNLRPVDTRAAIEGILQVLRPKLEESGGEVEIEPLPLIEADLGQIERLFTNLIGNAIKFRGKEPPHIRIAAEQRGSLWEFTIADNGIGIAPEFREKVFEIFSRLHSRQEYDGTGIGLAACRRIVEMHGGKIWVEEGKDGGCIFHFTLPEHQEEKREAA